MCKRFIKRIFINFKYGIKNFKRSASITQPSTWWDPVEGKAGYCEEAIDSQDKRKLGIVAEDLHIPEQDITIENVDITQFPRAPEELRDSLSKMREEMAPESEPDTEEDNTNQPGW